jgi:nickel/cobalt exporter
VHSFQDYLAHGQGWLFIPAAILLGALHGLEPGHSKTMMAAFIISIRGTVMQAVLLGLCAAFSHTLVIWVLAAIGLHFSGQLDVEGLEPWFQIATGVIIVGMAAWMFRRIQREQRAAHGYEHKHHHPDDDDHGHHHHHSAGEAASEYQDEHEREHAQELQSRFAGQTVTTKQIILFGLTGGLMPCPAAFAILLVCLQIKQFALGFAVVLAFSVGLAITLVAVGSVAALSVREASRRFSGFGQLARRLPYASVGLMSLIGVVLAGLGLKHILH